MHTDTPTLPAAKIERGELLTDVEVATLCGCAVQTLRNMRWRGTGPRFVKLGARMVRYRPDDVRAFIENEASAT